MSSNIILWLVVGTTALVIDLLTSSFLFFWFTLGAMVALVGEICNLSLAYQIIMFTLTSIILMIIGYPLVKKYLNEHKQNKLPVDKNFVGEIFILNQDLIKEGICKFQGVLWRVESKERLKKGDRVKIISVIGNKLSIKREE